MPGLCTVLFWAALCLSWGQRSYAGNFRELKDKINKLEVERAGLRPEFPEAGGWRLEWLEDAIKLPSDSQKKAFKLWGYDCETAGLKLNLLESYRPRPSELEEYNHYIEANLTKLAGKLRDMEVIASLELGDSQSQSWAKRPGFEVVMADYNKSLKFLSQQRGLIHLLIAIAKLTPSESQSFRSLSPSLAFRMLHYFTENKEALNCIRRETLNNSERRHEGIGLLAGIITRNNDPVSEEILVDAFKKCLEQHGKYEAPVPTFEMLREFKSEKLKLLMIQLARKEDRPRIRMWAIHYLKNNYLKQSVDIFTEALKSSDPECRDLALSALVVLRGRIAITELNKALKNRVEVSNPFYLEIVRQLALLGEKNETMLEILRHMLMKDGYPYQEEINSFWIDGKKRAAGLLIKLAQEEGFATFSEAYKKAKKNTAYWNQSFAEANRELLSRYAETLQMNVNLERLSKKGLEQYVELLMQLVRDRVGTLDAISSLYNTLELANRKGFKLNSGTLMRLKSVVYFYLLGSQSEGFPSHLEKLVKENSNLTEGSFPHRYLEKKDGPETH